jgi:hypothetical protein
MFAHQQMRPETPATPLFEHGAMQRLESQAVARASALDKGIT